MARDASRLSFGCTATLAPMKPILRLGLSSFIASAVFTSLAKDGRRGMQDKQLVLARVRRDVGEAQTVRRRVDQLRVLDQGRGLREPGREPERANLAPHLVAGAGAAIEAVIRGSLQEERPHMP